MFDFLWPSGYKRWAYPKISPVTCEWWKYIFILIILWTFSKNVLVVKTKFPHLILGEKSITLKSTYAYVWGTKFWNFSFTIAF